MNGKHSLDDLFARVLGDAEVNPPPAVWEGVARSRGWGHRTLRQLKRNWGYSAAAILLLAGGVTLWATQSAEAPSHLASAQEAAPTTPAPVTNGAAAGTAPTNDAAGAASEASAKTVGAPTGSTSEAASSATPNSATEHAAGPSSATGTSTNASNATNNVTTPARVENTTSPTATGAPTHKPLSTTGSSGSSRPHTSGNGAGTHTGTANAGTLDRAPGDAPSSASVPSPRTAEHASEGSTTASANADAARSVERDATDVRATFHPARYPAMERTLAEAAPARAEATAYVLPHADRWIGAVTGFYQEQRSWKGNDAGLVEALDRTETPHYPWSIGVAAGREYRSGWGLSVGAEYMGARYRFEHEDRIVQRTETTQQIMVTLNTEVIDSYLDTIVTVTEQRNTSRATNTYAAVRIPVEASYHANWRRWQYGLRAGVAAEFITMRSGLTLDVNSETGSEYAVDVAETAPMRHSNTLITGSLGLDLGYLLSERFSIWATPSWTKGIAPLGGNSDAYAMPDRWGIRFRLAYTLPHK